MAVRTMGFLLVLVLTGCGLGYRTILPPTDLNPLSSTGFYSHCQDPWRAECHLFYLSKTPITVQAWTEPAFPFGTIRYSDWRGDYPFWTRAYFPFGLPTVKGEHCALQTYGGIKVEGTIHRELNALYKNPGYPLEFKPTEQHAVRIKCDLDVTPDVDNMAGF